ncbi:MAG: nitrogenase molybdenum-iron protein subunit beta [Candidatus Azobacteroides pseudotrichonymphae]|jgi:nitrogenase molybdenum-iron protein beta chain|uniref:Nitrogenase molybdenum-iron protein beta subunit 1 n=1 Tax=Azobacteroides pseudotrichonymphae genomovar. CFP2 TaxID=511995 RepID=B6YRJ0_AZOPC|nr:nitrogenase component 1 [Candidatus Azobacteroides pseudotrichonymphae]MDR0530185.1 nitrogenase molybdenum-iron protein subunit beta [Bacteroidales bacterium OttesenSCG-928-I14]BAG83812.1 nitrogenase molybdenum-iron protein beta subunit 1 [Candidatus Azobacteroides pseudotrichonymphae genomovar. CFP2]GMO35508.1 MAG: nitrogenase molybdenum-iron protein subunit beta [Candidatus Azobacteroides pseudotrichonymphae]
MLLRHTTAKEIQRKALTINPAKTCQPVGAMYAALGLHRCLPHSHGSQGCCSYHRSTLTRHFKEPVMAATSSFSEGSSVFGGSSNLVSAIDTIFTVYEPDIIAVHTTCLSETIGDDMTQIISKAKEEGKIPEGKIVIYCNTPSYVGTHITGYSNQISAFVKFFSTATPKKKNVVNLVAGWMEPSDMREIKRIARVMEARIILFPDMSGVLDTPLTGKFEMYPSGGTTIQEIIATGDSKFTIGLGAYSTEDACVKLENKCRVRFEVVEIPIGLKATDRFVISLSRHANVPVPDVLTEERGRLVDLIADNSKYFYKKRVALFGDPDTLIPLTEFLLTLDMKPVYIVTGTPGKHFDESIRELLSERVPEAKYKSGERADMFQLHQWIKQEPVDLLIGNTYGKYIARDENIPFIRLGFPVTDRPGNNYFPHIGYVGASNLVTKFLEKMLDYQDRTCPESKVEFQM